MTDFAPPGPPKPVDPGEFRLAMGRFASGVCVITTRWRGMDHAMTASAVASVSMEPPMVLFTVHRDSRFRESLDDQPLWALSILDTRARANAEWLSTPGRPLVDQLATIAHEHGVFSGAALIVNSLAWMECETAQIVRAGDHDVVIGKVIRVERAAAPSERPLLHFQGRFHYGPGCIE